MPGSRPAVLAGVISAACLSILVFGYLALFGGQPVAYQRPLATPSASKGPQLYSPFTGEPISRLGPELIFKIDNVQQARPPTGLPEADIVYILPVEGGLSRIFAVFSSHIPAIVGPVRSARAEDIELLKMFGRPAFAYSGAKPDLLPLVEHANIVDLYAGIVNGYYRDLNRVEPYNLYARTKVLLSQAHGESKAHNIGFVFGSAPAGGRKVSSYSVSYSAAAFTFRWSASKHLWLSWMDGSPADSAAGGQMGGATVVIQKVVVGNSHFLEYDNSLAPYANTVGSGTATVLRDGREYQVRWSRPNPNDGTTFTQADGRPMPFARGQVWVVIAYGPGSTSRDG